MIFKNTKSYLVHGILLGCFATSYMTSSVLMENKMLFVAIFLLFWAINRFKSIKDKKAFTKIMILGILIGYFLNFLFLYGGQIDYQYSVEQQAEQEINENAAILVLPTYPKFYEPKTWKHIISNSPNYSKIQKKIFSPFILYKYKKIYKKAGLDPSTQIAKEFENTIKKSWKNNDGNLYIAYLNQKPLLEEQIIKAIQGGAKNIGIINILLDQSDQWFQIQERVEKVRFYNYNAHVFYNNPFWEEEDLKQALVKKIEDATKEKKKSKVGVLLVGSGYTDRANINVKEADKQQIAFARDIKNHLMLRGYENKKTKMAFLNSNQYSIKRTISEILDQGISELVVAPIYIPFDNLYSTIIIPEQVEKIEIPSSIKVNYVSGWNTHPDFMKAVYRKLDDIYNEELPMTK